MDRYTEFEEVEYACSEGYVWSKYTWKRQAGIEDQHSIIELFWVRLDFEVATTNGHTFNH